MLIFARCCQYNSEAQSEADCNVACVGYAEKLHKDVPWETFQRKFVIM
jgi:hypothetical protein